MSAHVPAGLPIDVKNSIDSCTINQLDDLADAIGANVGSSLDAMEGKDYRDLLRERIYARLYGATRTDRAGKGRIRITFIGDTHRGSPREYDTDDLAEALTHAAEGFRLHPNEEGAATNRGPDTWLFCLLVERDGERMTLAGIEHRLQDILSLERLRAERGA